MTLCFCESFWPKIDKHQCSFKIVMGNQVESKAINHCNFSRFWCQLIYDLLASSIHAKRRNCLLASLLIHILFWSQEAFQQSLLNIKSHIKAILKLSFPIWHISFDIKVRNPSSTFCNKMCIFYIQVPVFLFVMHGMYVVWRSK